MQDKEVQKIAFYGVNPFFKDLYDYFLKINDENIQIAVVVQVKNKREKPSFSEALELRQIKKDFKSKFPKVPFLTVDSKKQIAWEKFGVDMVIDCSKAEKNEQMEQSLFEVFKRQALFHFPKKSQKKRNKKYPDVLVCTFSRMAIFESGEKSPVFETQIPLPPKFRQVQNVKISPKGMLSKTGKDKENG
jgi:hypothetical protein